VTAAPNLPERSVWTVDDLDEVPPDLHYELINGRLVVAPPAVPVHQNLANELWLALRANCPPDYMVSTDQSLKVNRHNEPRPDVVAIRVENLDRSPVPVEDAVLAIEVISPTSQFRDMVEKADIYASAGIATYWIVDQSKDDIQLTEMVLDRQRRRYLLGGSTTGVFSVTEPWPITIDLPGLSRRRAELLERAAKAR
jgi:Uma2 family endonuclease